MRFSKFRGDAARVAEMVGEWEKFLLTGWFRQGAVEQGSAGHEEETPGAEEIRAMAIEAD
jgi:hypothetical protein